MSVAATLGSACQEGRQDGPPERRETTRHRTWRHDKDVTIMQGLQPSVVLAVALAFTPAVEAQIREPFPDDVFEPVAASNAGHGEYRATLLSGSGMALEPVVIREPGASYVKVHFSEFNLPPGMLLEVSNPAGSEVYRYTQYSRDALTVDHARGDDGVTRFSAMSISGDTAVVRLVGMMARFDPNVHGVEIDSYMHGNADQDELPSISHIEKALGTGKPRLEFACGANERYDSACWKDSYPDHYDRARPVALLITARGMQCTAWRVGSDNRMFTAEHCIADQSDLDATEIWFNYRASACGGSSTTQEVKVTGKELLATDRTLDYALFSVNDFETITKFGNLGLDVRNGAAGESIFIPQHGLGNPQQIAIESDMNVSGLCEIDDPSRDAYGDDTDIGYYCDTTTSSSGSPVVSGETGKVIALHHLGGCLNMGAKVSKIWPQVSAHFGGKVPRGDSNADWAPANETPKAAYLADCDELSCNFDAVDSRDSDGSIAAYHWDFGDGSDSKGLIVEHRFQEEGQFNVALTVEDNEGATDTIVTEVHVTAPNQSPTASFSTVCVDNQCSLNGSGSEDADGRIDQWAWDFGDGAGATGRQVNHDYASSGSYTITLTVVDDEGAKDRSSHTVEVLMPNAKPAAVFSFNCIKRECSFDASESRDSDGEITTYRWDFGDGTSGSGRTSEHRFSANGSYTVALTVHDDRGKYAVVEQTVQVDGVNLAPQASFTVDCDGLVCRLDAGGSTDDGHIVSYRWILGDGKAATGRTVSHTFPASGKYSIRLTVRDNETAESSSSRTVSVEAPREIALNVSGRSTGEQSLAYLKWSGAETETVRILRNGKPLTETANSGRFMDAGMKRSGKGARYQVCESGSDLCSAEVSVRFGL